jgi:prolipoprotein diacylglyceryltransferase
MDSTSAVIGFERHTLLPSLRTLRAGAALFLPLPVVVATAALTHGAAPGMQAVAWGLVLSFVGLYAWAGRQANSGELIPAWLAPISRPLLAAWSKQLNRPFIVTLRGRHHFFLSYGLLQAAGAALFVLHFQVFFAGTFGDFDVFAMTLFSLVPMIGGNRLAGLFVQLFVEKLPLREALFKVRFLSVGFAAGMIAAIAFASWWWNVPVAAITDAAFVSVLWAQILGSLGCVYYGCCHGPVRHDGQGFDYAHPLLKPNRVLKVERICVTPTPLYCALFGAWILGFALVLRAHFELPVGLLTALAAGCFGLGRFAEEWFRADAGKTTALLTMNQVYAALLIALGIALGVSAQAAVWPAQPLGAVAEALASPGVYALPALLFLVVGSIYSYHRGSIGSWK